MAGQAVNLGIGGGLMGGPQAPTEGFKALYGNAKTASPIKTNVDLSDPKAMREEAARLAKSGHPQQSLELYNQAARASQNSFTASQQTKQTLADTTEAARLDSQQGLIPQYTALLAADPDLARYIPMLQDGTITPMQAEAILGGDEATKYQRNRDTESDARQKASAQLQLEASAREKTRFKNTQANYAKTIGRANAQILAQEDMANEMEGSPYANPQVIKQFRSGVPLAPSMVQSLYATWYDKDPQSQASKDESVVAFDKLTAVTKGLADSGNLSQQQYNELESNILEMQGQPAAVIDVYRAQVSMNSKRQPQRWPRPTAQENSYASQQRGRITDAVDPAGPWNDNSEEAGAYVMALAGAGPALAAAYGISASEGMEMAEKELFGGLDDGFRTAMDFNYAINEMISVGIEGQRVETLTQEARANAKILADIAADN